MHHPRVALAMLLMFAVAACTDETDQDGADGATADLILYDGHVLTLDAQDTVADVVVIAGERIAAIGGPALLERYHAERRVDLEGRTVMPGFIDSHVHISGDPPHYIDLTGVRSVAEIRALVSAKAAEVGPGNWITGYGWSEDELAEGRRPLVGDLDTAAPGHPVMLTRAGGHSAVCSSAALALADIDASTPNPQGGVIERDAGGALNGIIRERQSLVGELVPATTAEALRPSHVANLRALLALGITSIIQAQDTIGHYAEWQAIYRERRDELPRAAVQLMWEGPAAMSQFGLKTGDGDEHLRVGAIKVFVDGGFTGPAAYTKRPYKGQDEYRGKLNLTEAELATIVSEAHRAGWQLGIHAIGDAAIELTVDTLVAALRAAPRTDHRHYLNHFTMMPSAATMDDMATNGIAITQQPNFTYTLEGRYVANLDGQRLETNNPLRTPVNHGIRLALSSDILPIGPMVGIYAATTRRGMSGRVFGAEEKLSRLEALRGYTIKGAWLTREESIKGTLEPGKLADLIVLGDNPLMVSDEALLELPVLQTYVGGRLVYARDALDVAPTRAE